MVRFLEMLAVLGFTALMLVGAIKMFDVHKDYLAKQQVANRVAVSNALLNYQSRYGTFPYKELMTDNKVPDKSKGIIEKRITAGTISNTSIIASIEEIDLKALSDISSLNSPERYFMVKDNPYSAFCWKDVLDPTFDLVDKNKLYDFRNAQVSSANLTLSGKTMTQVNSVCTVTNNVTLIGGEGSLYLSKVVDSKAYPMTLQDAVSVQLITTKYIVATLTDGSTKVFDLVSVLN